MKIKPRKTATFIMQTKEKSIIEAQKYEIDKKKIVDFYGLKLKKERVYNVIKKDIAFEKESGFKTIDTNKRYSHYLVFRELLQKEFGIEDIKSDLEQVKLLINVSENTRNEFYRFFQFDKLDYILNHDSHNQSQTGTKLDGAYTVRNTKSEENTRDKIKSDKFLDINDFIRKCKMLTRKRDLKKDDDILKKFKLFSELNLSSNKFEAMDSYYSNKNKLNNKYYLEKELLKKCFNREERFINYNQLIKDSSKNDVPDSLNFKTKDKYSSEYLDYIFDKREEKIYEQIDHFFSKYNITNFRLKNEEAEFFGKIYGILCKNNYMKFLSFLYSKNDIFKFIYDEFSDKDATISNFSLENSKIYEKKLTLIASSDLTDKKIKQKELAISNESIEKDNINALDLLESDNLKNVKKSEIMEQIYNSYLYTKIAFLNEVINEEKIIEFFNNEENEHSENNSIKSKKFINCLKECNKKALNDILLITNKKILFIYDSSFNILIEQKMSKTNFIKIDIDLIKNSIPLGSSEPGYYFIEIKKGHNKEYYLFKLGIKNINLLENHIKNNFKFENLKDIIKSKKKGKKKKKEPILHKKTKEEEKIKEIEKKEEEEDSKEEIKKIEEESHNSEKDKEVKPFNIHQNTIESYSSEKNKASILNEDSYEKSSIGKVIKDSNIKKTSKYQNNENEDDK